MKIFYRALNSHMAGGQQILLHFVKDALKNGHRPVVSVPDPGKLTEFLEEMGVRCHFISLGKTFYFHQAAKLAWFLKKEKFDLIHTHDMVAGNVLVRTAGYWAGIPVISHIHIPNEFNRRPMIRRYQIFLDNATSKQCAKIIAVSKHTQRALINQGIPSSLVEVVYNGVEPSGPAKKSKDELLKELSLPADAKLIGCVGRLCAVKGQKELIEAAAQMAGSNPKLFFVFVGKDIASGGRYEIELKNLAERLGVLPYIRFAGYQSDVNSFMQAFECLALPSWIEGLPLAALEAMACGKPVVAADVGGTSELVLDGETGFLVSPRNASRLVSALQKTVSDPERARKMGEQGRRRILNSFSQKTMLGRVREIYAEAVNPQEIQGKKRNP